MRHVSFPKIVQFRDVVRTIKQRAEYAGKDLDGEPIYGAQREKPTITFKGTVKLHGTNASICIRSIPFNINDLLVRKSVIWAQSRSQVIEAGVNDNAGFAQWVDNNHTFLETFLLVLRRQLDVDLTDYMITVYGEWVGKGIQKGVGISKLEEKAFIIFDVKVSPVNQDSEEPATFVGLDVVNSAIEDYVSYNGGRNDFGEKRIFTIDDFPTYSIDIDFNNPALVQNQLVVLTDEVEKECPVAKAFGFPNDVGEGIVWRGEYDGAVYRFKVKGEKHSVSKVKTLAEVDVEKMADIEEFVEYAATINRFNQGVENTMPNELDIKKLGDLIRWVINDIFSEEQDVLDESGLTKKDVQKAISDRVRRQFFNYTEI